MLSIILYGRNDSHGYNLHKRAALSLNAIAAVLSAPDDEIIFVDYNTPDELPTFPEAIGDTLTDPCKARLRVLRVRPDVHKRIADKTRLVALESQSRNIAIRRANPANKWILSTNTDMVFCTENPAQSLSDVIGRQKDGFYHLPRFELPEGFWERLPRTDAQGAIAALRENGRRFHINEIVWGIEDNLFEAPGDFQLFLREDLYAIEGFDERMLMGWHADSNIARRMRILRGEVGNLFPQISGYHCGHTRQATSLHGGNRTQNDFEFFVTSIEDPVAHHQAGRWGAPDDIIEEVRLDRPDGYFAGMAAAVPAAGPSHSEVTYNESSFGKIDAEADHVLPHLCDLLFNFPAARKIFFFGPDIRLLNGVRDFLETAGRQPRFLMTDLAASPSLEGLDQTRWAGAVRPLGECLDEADILLMQYPHASQQPQAERLEAEWWSQRVFAMFADRERAKPVSERRRAIVVNAIHTGITNMVEATLAPTVTPFSSRLRQGYVIDDSAVNAQRNPMEGAIYTRLGRTQLFTPQDRTLLDRVTASLQDGKPVKGWERLAPEIAAICSSPAPIPANFGFEAAEASAWAAAADVAMRLNIARAIETPVPVGPRVEIGNRILSGADWDNPDWARLAVSYFSPETMSFRERKRWVWERASLAHAIHALMPPPLPEAKPRRILLLARWPEFLTAVLTHMGYEVLYATPDDFLSGAVSADWRPGLDLSSMLLPKPLVPYEAGKAPADGFDALVCTLPSLFEGGGAMTEALMRAADPLMADNAMLFATATVQMNEIAYEGGFSYAEWKALYAPEGPLGMRGFEPVGGFDVRIPLDTVVRFAFEDDPQDSIPGLSYGFLKGFNSSALICAAWPQSLSAGPTARIEWGEPNRPDPRDAYVPYGGGQAAVMTEQASAAAPAAQAAMFAARKTPAVLALEALAKAPRLTLADRPLNALAFIQPITDIQREIGSALLTTPGGAGLVLPLEPKDAAGFTVSLGLDDGVTIAEAMAVEERGASLPLRIEGAVLHVGDGQAPLPSLALVIRFDQAAARVTGVTVSAAERV
jgi:hypothetical protein